MQIRLMRLKKGWSQEQLAEMSGLSTRTIQRIERGATASPETLKCLAAVFGTDFETLQEHIQMPQQDVLSNPMTQAEQEAVEYVRDIKAFYEHLFTFVVVNLFLTGLNLFVTPGYFWAGWVIAGWGVGVALHAVSTFELITLFSPDWEKRQIDRRLGR